MIGVVVGTLSVWVVARPGYSGERVTNEMMLETIGRTHDVMKAQRERLQVMLDGFLIGDMQLVGKNADAVAVAMRRVRAKFPPNPQQEAEVWQIMAEVADTSQKLQEAVKEEDYKAAYRHFTFLAGRCIACHQVRRSWGTFEESESEMVAADGVTGGTGAAPSGAQQEEIEPVIMKLEME